MESLAHKRLEEYLKSVGAELLERAKTNDLIFELYLTKTGEEIVVLQDIVAYTLYREYNENS